MHALRDLCVLGNLSRLEGSRQIESPPKVMLYPFFYLIVAWYTPW